VAYAGKLTCVVDPNGTQYVFLYDPIGRLTDIGAGGVSSSTCKRFRFDTSTGVLGSIPTGITITNPFGRLVEAETDDCTFPVTVAHQITDEWFSYDAAGHMTDMWEKTPHSTQYYHSVATFYEDGQVASLQLASPSLYTVSFGLDGEGRLSTSTDTTHSKTMATGATFFPAANPETLNWGTDKDEYTIDAIKRISNYKFVVGAANLNGALTWNDNDTLKTLTTTDGFNAGGSLTCNSGYDDKKRITSFDCGAGNWGQTFTYDPYDNLTKTQMASHAGTSWNPTYSATTNHYNCGVACIYDSNGNVKGDGVAVYGWNEFSKLAWTAASGTPTCGTSGRCITYDAFGRILETSTGSTWVERWYTQLGETANMSGTTINFAYWPAPLGSTSLVTGNGTSYFFEHKDWVGSVRVASSNGHTVTIDRAFTPYGEVSAQFGTGVAAKYYNFAGLTANFDQGVMYDSPNRELSIVGRWLSPDPANQGWNQYAYPTNPNSFNDPSGLCETKGDSCFFGGGNEGNDWGGGFWGDGFWGNDPCVVGDNDMCDSFPGDRGRDRRGRGKGIFSGQDFPFGESLASQLASLLGNIFPCQTDFGAPCDPQSEFISTGQPANPSLQAWMQPVFNLFDLAYPDLGPPRLARSRKKIDCAEKPCLTNADKGVVRAVTGFWDALQTCAQFLPVIMNGGANVAPESADLFPEATDGGTQNTQKPIEYNPGGHGWGTAVGNAMAQVGGWSGCTGGAAR
jgi:RHS repeat-associated protein